MPTKRATIDDVAALAGVSIKTVSRVLNREPKVRPKTSQRVHEAMKSLHYRPNSSARQLAGNRTYLLGLIYSAGSSYISRIQNGVLEACHDQHYDLLIHPCHYKDPTLVDQLRELLTAPKVDGLILTPPVSDVPEVEALMKELDAPFVSLSRASLDEDLWSVGTDDYQVSVRLVNLLAGLGHKRMAYIGGHEDHLAMANRFRGFRAGMAHSGLVVDPELCIRTGIQFKDGIEAARKLLSHEDRPTAILCANDQTAAGVVKVAHEMGLKIPDDLSVTGFDDVPLAEQLWPPLTTVRQPLNSMSKLATEILLKQLRGAKTPGVDRLVPSALIVRDSTGPAPTSKSKLTH